MLNKQA